MRRSGRHFLKRLRWRTVILRLAEGVVFAGTALFLYLALRGVHPTTSPIRNYLITNGSTETGALNLVTSIYLGFRAYDTLGETIVLLLAVSGVLLFVEKRR